MAHRGTAVERHRAKAPPLALDGPAEIQNAASAFNEMQARLNRYVEDRTTLVAAIAHDLRTPLMRLGLRLENAPAELRTACEADIRDMEQMIAAVMAFVRDMNRPSRRQRLDLRALAQSVTDGFDDEGASVTLHDGPPLVIEGDAAALKALLVNLVGNAVKYAGGAEIALAAEDNMAVIAVSDRGPGMTQEDLDRAFEPFFRAERSRNRDTGGIGLGLASVRAVARAHGGEAQLVNRPEGGLLARVTLPL
jgi:signal transduction histidine kinase